MELRRKLKSKSTQNKNFQLKLSSTLTGKKKQMRKSKRKIKPIRSKQF